MNQTIIDKCLLEIGNEYRAKIESEIEAYNNNDNISLCSTCLIEMDLDYSNYVCKRCGLCEEVLLFEEDPPEFYKMKKMCDKSYSREKYFKQNIRKITDLTEDEMNIFVRDFRNFIYKFFEKYKPHKKKMPYRKFIFLRIAIQNKMCKLEELYNKEEFPSYYSDYISLFE
jgi:hypothetical protein